MRLDQNLVNKLALDGKADIKPTGNSMTPLIKSGDLVSLIFVDKETQLKKGDIVFCKVKGRFMLHLITAIEKDRYQISNNHGYVNGWIGRDKIYGKYSGNRP